MHRVLAVRLYPVLLDDAAVDAIPHRPPDCRRDALRVKLDAQVDVIHPAHDRPAGAAGVGGTRLVTRIHAVYDWQHPLMALLGVILMEFGDFAMLRRMYLISDLIEVAQGGFSTFRLSLTYAGEAAIPLFVIGLYAVQRPRIGRLGLFGAVAYAYSYVFFTSTVVYALIAGIPNYAALVKVFGAWMTVHGLIMLAGGFLAAAIVALVVNFPIPYGEIVPDSMSILADWVADNRDNADTHVGIAERLVANGLADLKVWQKRNPFKATVLFFAFLFEVLAVGFLLVALVIILAKI